MNERQYLILGQTRGQLTWDILSIEQRDQMLSYEAWKRQLREKYSDLYKGVAKFKVIVCEETTEFDSVIPF